LGRCLGWYSSSGKTPLTDSRGLGLGSVKPPNPLSPNTRFNRTAPHCCPALQQADARRILAALNAKTIAQNAMAEQHERQEAVAAARELREARQDLGPQLPRPAEAVLVDYAPGYFPASVGAAVQVGVGHVVPGAASGVGLRGWTEW